MESGYYEEYEDDELGLPEFVILAVVFAILFVPIRIVIRSQEAIEWLKHITARY